MKKIMCIILPMLILMLVVCSCAQDNAVVLDDVVYRTSFYGDLYVADLPRSEEPVIKNENNRYKNFYRVENTEYDFLITYPGGINGELYCPESEWEDLKQYYENSDNFVYYCETDYGNFKLENIDAAKFDELMDFAKQNSYVPFGLIHNEAVDVLSMPIPNSEEYVFYKQSKDNIFKSSKGEKFLIADGKLVLLFYYDYHHGEAEAECIYVNVPEDLSSYFVSLVNEYLS